MGWPLWEGLRTWSEPSLPIWFSVAYLGAVVLVIFVLVYTKRKSLIVEIGSRIVDCCKDAQSYMEARMLSARVGLLAEEVVNQKISLRDLPYFYGSAAEMNPTVMRYEDLVVERYELGNKVLAFRCYPDYTHQRRWLVTWGVVACPHDIDGNQYPVGEFERHPLVDELILRGVLTEAKSEVG